MHTSVSSGDLKTAIWTHAEKLKEEKDAYVQRIEVIDAELRELIKTLNVITAAEAGESGFAFPSRSGSPAASLAKTLPEIIVDVLKTNGDFMTVKAVAERVKIKGYNPAGKTRLTTRINSELYRLWNQERYDIIRGKTKGTYGLKEFLNGTESE